MTLHTVSKRDDLFALPNLWMLSAFSTIRDNRKDEPLLEVNTGISLLSPRENTIC